MAERWKIYGLIALITLFIIPVAMVCAHIDVPVWALIVGHSGSMLTGFIAAELNREAV
ncbi:hypothetical protein MML63_12290 [Kosakonia sacchari]|uniref:hypothetical protein n=1 Tax=Kosakonia sacchari TaxID=1158459 RepID=UPI0025AF4D5C|nr:hypothetical protein [Kosakonia sacchari]MDN2486403.1 hypothetical protein [Kosakonia sacchari]